MKHAYLILAHADFKMLQTLVNLIDDVRNDIFIHIDRKSTLDAKICTQFSSLCILEDRIDVHWGGISIVEAEYKLLEAAEREGPYDYYHLLSGADIPIKSQDFIHNFFTLNRGKEFIGFAECTQDEINSRARLWHLFPEEFKTKNIIKRVSRRVWIHVQKVFHLYRKDHNVKKGSQWFSVTDSFVKYTLSSKDNVLHIFSHTFAPDELFVQTLCWNSEFRSKVFDLSNEWDGCMRFINWIDGELVPISEKDIPVLMMSNKLFARKVTSSQETVITAIKESIQ